MDFAILREYLPPSAPSHLVCVGAWVSERLSGGRCGCMRACPRGKEPLGGEPIAKKAVGWVFVLVCERVNASVLARQLLGCLGD